LVESKWRYHLLLAICKRKGDSESCIVDWQGDSIDDFRVRPTRDDETKPMQTEEKEGSKKGLEIERWMRGVRGEKVVERSLRGL
jgi:hypothetical protein